LENNSESRFCVDCEFFQNRPSYEIRGPLCLNDRYVSLKLTNLVMGDSVSRTYCRSARGTGGKCQDGLFFQARVSFFKRIKLMFSKRIKKKETQQHVV